MSRKKQDPTASPDAGANSPGTAPPNAQGGSQLVAANASPGTPGQAVSPGSALVDQAAPSGSLTFVFCHLVAGGSEYLSDIFPSTGAASSTLEAAFWQQIGKQYRQANIPYRNNVACVHSPTEAGAVAAQATLTGTAAQRGITAGHEISTGWTYSGDSK